MTRPLIVCKCPVVNVLPEPACPLPATQEDFLCDYCRAGHPKNGQRTYYDLVHELDTR